MAALVTICALGAAVPTDYLVAFVLETDKTFRTPSVYLSIVAFLLALPFLPGAGLGRRIAPILLIGGSMLAAIGSLLALRWSDVVGGPLGRLDWPFRLVAMSVLFAFAASQRAWRGRLIACYLAGWAAFVAYGLYLLLSGRFAVLEHYEVARASIIGLNTNEQSVLVASGIVVVFDAMLVSGSLVTIPLYLGALLTAGVVFASGVSRTGTLALAGGLVVVLVGWLRSGAAKRSSRAIKLALRLVLLGGGGVVVVRESDFAGDAAVALALRLHESFAGRDLGRRDELAYRTWRIAAANPLHGVGFGRAQHYLGGNDPHNGYLRILAEGGVLAALLFVAGLLRTGSSLARELGRRGGAGPAAALVVQLISAAAGQAFVEVPFWFFLGVVVAGAADGVGPDDGSEPNAAAGASATSEGPRGERRQPADLDGRGPSIER